MPRRLGLIVNPIAGMGGAAGLKGTDGPDVLAEAVRRGARLCSARRANLALAELGTHRDGVQPQTPSSARETIAAAQVMRERGMDLILFAGGDGTARDIHAAVGEHVPILGIPTGVKMHSGVFATSPAAAGRLAFRFLESDVRFAPAEIMDIDEAALRAGHLSARLYGYARVPVERRLMQSAKARSLVDDGAMVAAAARAMAAELRPGISYVVGPGRSAKQVLAALKLEGALLGVDLLRDGRLIGRDLAAGELTALIANTEMRIVTGVTGAQGFVFGRGNQQIGPDLIARAGRDGILAIAGRRKLAMLSEGRVLADTGDAALDRALEGHLRVRCGAQEWAVMRLAAA